jgi:hypothetical protein
MYTPREGRVDCIMTYAERVAPLQTLPVLLYETLAEDVDFKRHETRKIARFISDEGEYGARIVTTGEHHGMPVAHIVAAIFTEDFSTRLTARVEMDRLDHYIALVDELARGDRLMLGTRRRRIAYRPPAGWHPVPGLFLEVGLFPPDYPRRHSCIVAFPAEPLQAAQDPKDVQERHDERVGICRLERTCTEVITRNKLRGEEWRSLHTMLDGKRMRRHLVILRDRLYCYTLRLETLDEEAGSEHEAFMDMVGSVEPIPPVRHASAPHPSLWID